MQDDMSDEDAIAIAKTMLLQSIPTPNSPEVLSDRSRLRLQELGLKYYAERLAKTGLGMAKNGRIAITEPVFADKILATFGVLAKTDIAATLTYTSFGIITVVTKLGHEIRIDPVIGDVNVYEGIPEDAIWIELNVASRIQIEADQVRGPDALIGMDGKDLHSAAERRLGKLNYGSCYMLPLDLENENRFAVDSIEIGNVISYVEAIHAQRKFTINRFPYDPQGPDSENMEGYE